MDDPLDTDVTIEAPEHIVFRHVVAGPGRRALAHVLDLFVCYTIVVIVSALTILAFLGMSGFAGAFESAVDAGAGVILVVLFAAQWLYSFLWEGITGRSPGKMALDLRVVMVSGRPIGFAASALRNVLRAAIAELLGFPDTPVPVVINESLEIARRYSAPESLNFLNGVLDAMAKELVKRI